MSARYTRLFGLAKELGLSKEDLSAGAAQWSGVGSLRSLSQAQVRAYEAALRRERESVWKTKRSELAVCFEENGYLSDAQRNFMIDLVAKVFNGSIEIFRAWLQKYFMITSERFLDNMTTRRVIKALEQMRSRGFQAWGK